MKDYIFKSPTFWLCLVCAIIGGFLSPPMMEGLGVVLGAVVGLVIRIALPLFKAIVDMIGDIIS